MKASAFKQIDVFTSRRHYGNALAVILDADGLETGDMQRIAAWTNLSETTFVLTPTRPEASYRLRIFTPRTELPFAGHPSVGTAHALLEAGMLDPAGPLLQECAAGLLPVRVEGDGAQRRVFVRAPRARVVDVPAGVIAEFTRALGAPLSGRHPAQVLNNGPGWLICDLGDAATVRGLQPDLRAIDATSAKCGVTGICVFGRSTDADHALAVRAFAPADGIPEDPVTGSANAAIGTYLLQHGLLDAVGSRYRASQGREVGRDGFVDVAVDEKTGEVEIGGQSITCIDGMFVLPA